MNEEKRVSGITDETFAELSIKQLFVTVLTAGTIAIIIGVAWASPLLLTVLAPLCLVVAYAALSTRVRNTDLSKAKIGDSCYFLGFSFTLVSLSVALINLGQQQGDEVNINAIVGGFGAALSTTLAGLLCRLWFTTLASSFQSSRDKLEEEIEGAMRTFSLQLQNLVEEVNMSIKVIGSTIGDTNLELNKSYKGQMQDNIKTISESIANFSQRLDEVEISKDMVVKPVSMAMAGMIETLNAHSEKMALTHSNIIKGTSGLSEQIDSSNNLVNNYIDRFSQEFQRISDAQMAVFANTTDKVNETLSQNLSGIRDINVSVSDSIGAELDVLKSQLNSVSNLTEASNAAMAKTNEININAAQILTAASDNLPKIISGIESAAEPVTKSSEDIIMLSQSLSSFNTNLLEVQASLEGFKHVTSEATQKFNTTSQAVDQASLQLSRDISDIYSDLAAQLKALRSSVD